MPAQTLPLSNKTAIITGGSKGIGAAISLALSALGANVVINYSSDASTATSLVSRINGISGKTEKTPPQAISIKGDAGSIPDIEALVAETVKVYGKIDIVVCNAGIMPLQPLAATTEQIFDNVMRLNVKGPFFLAQKAAPHMPSGSHIIFVSTSLCGASTVTPPYLAYVTSKGAVEQMTRVMSKELAAKGVFVNAIAPGPTGTELFLKGKSEQMLEGIRNLNPQHRIGTPEEVAEAVVYLSGEGSRWVSGQVLRVNGGFV